MWRQLSAVFESAQPQTFEHSFATPDGAPLYTEVATRRVVTSDRDPEDVVTVDPVPHAQGDTQVDVGLDVGRHHASRPLRREDEVPVFFRADRPEDFAAVVFADFAEPLSDPFAEPFAEVPPEEPFRPEAVKILSFLSRQAQEISQGVTATTSLSGEQGESHGVRPQEPSGHDRRREETLRQRDAPPCFPEPGRAAQAP